MSTANPLETWTQAGIAIRRLAYTGNRMLTAKEMTAAMACCKPNEINDWGIIAEKYTQERHMVHLLRCVSMQERGRVRGQEHPAGAADCPIYFSIATSRAIRTRTVRSVARVQKDHSNLQ